MQGQPELRLAEAGSSLHDLLTLAGTDGKAGWVDYLLSLVGTDWETHHPLAGASSCSREFSCHSRGGRFGVLMFSLNNDKLKGF